MEFRVKKPALALAMGILVLALAGVGCGDDDGSGGTSGSSGTGGTGGTSGTGGTGGTGGTPTISECVAEAGDALADILPLSEACLTCICTADVEATDDCTNNSQCWDLVNCSVVMCQGDTQCALQMCTAFLQGYTTATALRPSIVACQETCFPGSTMDAGDTDGGN